MAAGAGRGCTEGGRVLGELLGWWVGQRPTLPPLRPLRPLRPPVGRPAGRLRGCRTTSASGGAGLSRAPGAGRSARGPRQAGIRGSRAQLTTSDPQLAAMVAGVSLLLRALPLMLWGCRDAQPARLGYPELRQEAEVWCVPGGEGNANCVPSL